MLEVTFLGAFIAGVLAFLSPCVLPIIPAYLSYISGVGIEEVQREKRLFNVRIFLATLFFVVGFSIVFTMLGAGASFIGQFLRTYQTEIAKVGGGLVIFFGLHFAGAFLRPNFLKELIGVQSFITALYLFKVIGKETFFSLTGALAIVLTLYLFGVHEYLYRQLKTEAKTKASYIGAFVIGVVFAFGWTPCIGPILGSILFLASQQETVREGAVMLLLFSFGLGVPFLVAGLLFSLFLNFVKKFGKFFGVVEFVGGILLISLGLLLVLDKLSWFASLGVGI
ncbi:cytochrome c biogenesis protein CcdA [Hydrogenivirga sp. 128-5-R1-1]|uniref:cytochrome c biogenesis CcdA family protein n=1 Tax=Hydrogenivirga sp. 128-5-R1-1 TaxID=392423 RepID=UPI00015F0CB2|nr:cytochrome c biogenesis protein CcdA [Hydrogenivirga sp. 128-5-R1-1]EDP75829.1 cytochrome c-type biogenesis protein [Hydrogenivirga sp. 128-5-R1-1]